MDESLVRHLIAEHLAVPHDSVTEEALFRQDLGADSLDMIQLSMLIEHQLGLCLEDDEAELCPTVGDALRLLRSKCVGASDEWYASNPQAARHPQPAANAGFA